MKTADLRAIAARSRPPDPKANMHRNSNQPVKHRRRLTDYLYYGVLGLCGLSVMGATLRALEDPETREARLIEAAQQEREAAVKRAEAERERAEQAKWDAKAARLDACTEVEGYAFVLSQDAVRAKLRAPSTASFPWSPTVSKHVGNCKFRVLAYVDSQNGFGAMLRTNYIATLHYEPDTERWRVGSVEFGS